MGRVGLSAALRRSLLYDFDEQAFAARMRVLQSAAAAAAVAAAASDSPLPS